MGLPHVSWPAASLGAAVFATSLTLLGLPAGSAAAAGPPRPGPAGPPVSVTVTPHLAGTAQSGSTTSLTYRNCTANGPSAADAALAAQLSPQIRTDRLSGIDAGQISCARIIVGVVRSQGLPQRAAVLAMMTAIAESGLHNYTTSADYDSLGLFQQRPSQGWGTVAQVTDPAYATGTFLRVMQSTFRDSSWLSGDLGAVCQGVQRSAYPDEYDKQAVAAQRIVHALAGGGVAAVSVNGVYRVFSITPSGAFCENVGSASWSGWHALDGLVRGTPAATYHDGQVDVFALGSNGSVYQKTRTSDWGAWRSLGGTLTGGVAAVWANGANHVFAITTSGNLYENVGNATWSGWHLLGGTVQGTPAVSYHSGALDLFALGLGGHPYQKTFTTSWSAWRPLSGALADGAAAVWANDGNHVFGITAAGGLHQNIGNGSWSGWEYLGGDARGTPAATYSDRRFDVFVIGSDSGMWRKTFSAGWSDWLPLRGDFAR